MIDKYPFRMTLLGHKERARIGIELATCLIKRIEASSAFFR
jgi:hypothetical protein